MHLALGSTQLDLTRRAAVVGLVEPGADAAESVRRAISVRDAGADVVWLRRAPGTPVDEVVGRVALALDCPVGVDAVDRAEVDALAGAGAVLVGLASGRPDAIAAAAEHGLTVYLDGTPGTSVGLAPSRLVVEGHLGDDTAIHGCTVRGTGPATWGRVVVALQAGALVIRTVDVGAVRRVAAVTARLLEAHPHATPDTST